MSELLTNVEKATDRIRKLLATASNAAASDGERDTAMSMAMKLMARHNLEMAAFADKSVPKEKRQTATSEHHPCPWRRRVAGAIARMFFCEMFYTKVPGKQKYKYTFIGLESNVITAKEMTDWLIKSATQEMRKKQKEHAGDHAFSTSFLNAAGVRIESRCYQLKQAAEMESTPVSGSTAIVLVDVYKQEAEANNEFIAKELGIKLRTVQLKGQITDHHAASLGRQYGDSVPLNTQLTSSNTPRKEIA